MKDKVFYQSKSIWGFGLLGLALIGGYLGVIPDHVIIKIVEVVLGFLGLYGIRDAL